MLRQIYTPYRSFLSFIHTILTKLISYKLVLKKSYGFFWTQFADVLQILSFLQAGGSLPRLSTSASISTYGPEVLSGQSRAISC